jgi:hypothetical protein
LALAFDDDQGRLIFQAATSDEAIPMEQLRLNVTDLDQAIGPGFKLIGDLAVEYLPSVEPAGFQTQMLAAGYRSVLGAHLDSSSFSRSSFLVETAERIQLAGLAVARRVADPRSTSRSRERPRSA